MNKRMVGWTVGMVLLIEAAFMLPSVIWCLIDSEWQVILSILASAAITAAAGGVLVLLGRGKKKTFFAQDGFVTVALCWIALSVFGCLPFFISRQIPHYVDALFEVVSGFTTTGASILPEVEPLSRGLLYWRSFTHWLGGMGILVFALAVVPASKGSGGQLHLMRAESPGPSVDKFTPRLRQTAKILYGIYIGMTVLCVLFLLFGGMPLFDSLCTAFGTAGTGGFGIHTDSMASYSPYLQNVCTVFMLLFGVNFNIYYLLLIRHSWKVIRDEEMRFYLGTFALAVLLIAWDIRPLMQSAADSLHHAAFQVSSIMTTTGFSTVDFNQWPAFSKAILLVLMVLGACAGSTGGGIKSIRTLLLLKDLRRNLRQVIHPRSVQVVQLNGRTVENSVIHGVHAYMAAYWMIALGSFVVISLDRFSVETIISAVLACLNNIGPGLEVVGPASHYGGYSVLSKLILSMDMLLGRLEIFPLLALFSRRNWKQGF